MYAAAAASKPSSLAQSAESAAGTQRPKPLDQPCEPLRSRHNSPCTEQTNRHSTCLSRRAASRRGQVNPSCLMQSVDSTRLRRSPRPEWAG